MRELVTESVTPGGAPIRVYRHPNTGFQIYVGGWRVATRATRVGADAVVDRHINPTAYRTKEVR